MNKVYQRIWSKVKERWILVSEKVARAGGTALTIGAITLAAFLSFSGVSSALDPGALPTGGKITAGSGSIATSGSQMTVNQSTKKMIANWNTFNIGRRAGVTFKQPDAESTALNRINDQKASQILGSLSANGKIYLINPSGIVFGKGSQVNVGGLVASSLKIADSDFLAGKNKFYNAGYADDAGNVINQGDIKTTPGGVVALIAPKVTNEGTITAERGSVVLAAGNQVSVDFKGDGLISYTIDKGAVDALAVNKGLVKADGGLVVMTAKAADSMTRAVVNNSGVIEAQTLQGKGGRIMLLSDMDNGHAIVSGKLDASAPNGGDGGFIETSAYDIKIDDYAVITTNAPQGVTGTWLIDPTDFTIAAGSGALTTSGIGASALQTALAATNMTIATNAAGIEEGDINVNADVTWSANTLSLQAYGDININAIMKANNTAALDMRAGYSSPGSEGGTYNGTNTVSMGFNPDGTFKGRVDFFQADGRTPRSGTGFLTINGNGYTVITNLGAQGSTTGTDLQGMNGNLSGYYALGSNITASTTSTWNGGLGFAPIGNNITPFTGQFNGLGHTITSLNINRPTEDYVGLFGGNSGSISNVGSVQGMRRSWFRWVPEKCIISGSDNVGGLVGANYGTLRNSYSTAPVNGFYNVGGLIGMNTGTVDQTYAAGAVTGGSILGGLVGLNYGEASVTNSYAKGSVTAKSGTGDIVFSMDADVDGSIDGTGSIDVTGTGTGTSSVGDIAFSINKHFEGSNIGTGSIDGTSNINMTGTIKSGSIAGGLVGLNTGAVDQTYATGAVTGGSILGGLVGLNLDIPDDEVTGGQITDSYATGKVTGNSGTGDISFSVNAEADIIGSINTTGIISAVGSIDGSGIISGTGTIKGGNMLGGLVGLNVGGNIDGTSASGSVTGGSILGGLVGLNLDIPFDDVIGGQITDSSATGSVTGKSGVGDIAFSGNANIDGSINGSGSILGLGSVEGSIDGTASISGSGTINGGNMLGGLVGLNAGGNIDGSTASGSVTGGSILGGLVGLNFDIPCDEVAGGQITASSATGIVTGKSGIGDISFSVDADIDGIIDGSGSILGLGSVEGSIDGTASINGTVSIKGGNILGGLVGLNAGGNIDGATASGSVTGGSILGGLVGLNADTPFDEVTGGQITNSSATGIVTGKNGAGDISFSGSADISGIIDGSGSIEGMGDIDGSIDGTASVTGTVNIKGGNIAGGLVGLNAGGNIDESTASGSVTGGSILGGLVGLNTDIPFDETTGGQITNSSATGNVKGNEPVRYCSFFIWNCSYINNVGDITFSGSADIDGIVDGSGSIAGIGSIDVNIDGAAIVSGTGSIKGGNILGGLVGLNAGGNIDGTTASGSVTGGSILGGLVGLNMDIPFDEVTGGQITDSSSIGNVTGKSGTGDISFSVDADLDGTLDASMGTIFDVSLDGSGSLSGTGSIKGGNILGGLVGLNAGGMIDGTTASGSVTGGSILGGLVGLNVNIPFDEVTSGQITDSSATGSVTGTSGAGDISFSGNADIDGAFSCSMDANFDGTADFTGSIDGLGSISGTGSIKGGNILGGLVGLNVGGNIDGTTASGSVSGGSILGGLVGLNLDIPCDEVTGGQITDSSAAGSVTGTSGAGDISLSMDADVDGVFAYSMDTNFDGFIDSAINIDTTAFSNLAIFHVRDTIAGGNILGGLVGLNAGGVIDGTTASGNVSGGSILGSLVGLNYGGLITDTESDATGTVTSNNSIGIINLRDYVTVYRFVIYDNVIYIDGGEYVGGLIGYNDGL